MTVFTTYAHQALNLGGLPDQLASDLGRAVKPHDDRDLRHVIRKMIVPYVTRWDDESKQHLQRIIALALLEDDQDWMVGVWESDLPPFDLPDPPTRFFELLWEELFGSASPIEVLPDYETVPVDPDPTACNRMRVAPSQTPDIPPDLLPVPSQAEREPQP